MIPDRDEAMFGRLGGLVGTIFATPRGQRSSPGPAMARSITRTVTNRVAGNIAADLGKPLGGILKR